MRARRLFALIFVFILLGSSFAMAQEVKWGYPDEEEQQVEINIDKDKVSPELRSILEARERADVRIAELQALMATSDGDQLADLQKQIEQIKFDTEIEVLQIRLSTAREQNDTKAIEEIEQAIDQLLNPPVFEEDTEALFLREGMEQEGVKR